MDPQRPHVAPDPPHSAPAEPARTRGTSASTGTVTAAVDRPAPPGSPRAIHIGDAHNGTNGVKGFSGRGGSHRPSIGAFEADDDMPQSFLPAAAPLPAGGAGAATVAEELAAARALAGVGIVARGAKERMEDSQYVPSGYYVEEVAWRLHPPPRPGAGPGGDADDPSDANGGDDGVTNDDAERPDGERDGDDVDRDDDDAGDSGPSRRLRQGPRRRQRRRPPVAPPDPLPPAPPLPPLPANWSFDETTRVLLGKFRDGGGGGDTDSDAAGDTDSEVPDRISVRDQEFMLRMMERDDVTVVVEGLVHPERLDGSLWSMDYLEKTVGNDVYHRFRVFERVLEVDSGDDGDGGRSGGRKEAKGRRGGDEVPEAVVGGTDAVGAERVENGGRDRRVSPALCRVPQDAAPSPSRAPPKKRPRRMDAHGDGAARRAVPDGSGTGHGRAGASGGEDRRASPAHSGPEVVESRSPSNGANGDRGAAAPAPRVVSVAEESGGGACHVTYRESGASMALKIRDFVRYLDERRRQLSGIADRRRGAGLDDGCNPLTPEEDLRFRRREEEIFRFTDHEGTSREINCVDVVLYLIDYDMVKLLPSMHRDFVANFRFPEILPGETHCLMNAVNPGGRPFMGPNLYVTPPASFTHFHQDGHGTVDSGHQCLAGYNEVIILRRMTEEHKKHALFLLNGKDETMYDALYGLPHADGAREMPRWPNQKDIQACKEMNYYPSVFILKPGQFVHINKGRLHAFRKMAPTRLPAGDCHAGLRSTLLKQNRDLVDEEKLCVSVAWDWTYKGVTSEGTNRETAAILECTSLNRKHQTVSLAIPETSLLHIARDLTTRHKYGNVESSARISLVNMGGANPPSQSGAWSKGVYTPKPLVTLRGILPSFRYVAERHRAACALAEQRIRQTDGPRVSVSSRPNSWENPQKFALDPYGNDFFCKLCHEELSNLYMHCDGCETLLNKDFNICVSCHTEGKHKVKFQMHPLNDKRHSTINHTGNFFRDRQSRCPCKNGPVCKNCTFCAGCSCKCHQWFTLHFRLMDIGDETKLLERVESAVGDDPVRFSVETRKRLLACKPEPPPSKATQDNKGTVTIADNPVQANVLAGLKQIKNKRIIHESAKASSATKAEPNKVNKGLSREERKRARDSRATGRNLGDAAPKVAESSGKNDASRLRKKAIPKVLIDVPHDHDVLYGRYKSKTHPGNEKLRHLAREYWSRYNAAKNKKDVTLEILQFIRSSDPPGRFLRPRNTSEETWFEVKNKDDLTIKIGHVVADLHKYEQKSKGKKRTDGAS